MNCLTSQDHRLAHEGAARLCRYAAADDLDAVRFEHARGADLNAPAGADGRNALQCALAGGHDGMFKLLLELGADINAVSLHRADGPTVDRLFGKTMLLLQAIHAGADLVQPDTQGRTLLHRCAMGDVHSDIFREMLERGADPRAVDHYGRTALHFAARFAQPDTVAVLALAMDKAALDLADRNGMTPLQMAGARHLQTLYLVALGADTEAQSARDKALYPAPLSAAARSERRDILLASLQRHPEATPQDLLQALQEVGHHDAQEMQQILRSALARSAATAALGCCDPEP